MLVQGAMQGIEYAPPVLVFGDDASESDAAVMAVEALGARVAARLPLEEVERRLASQANLAAVCVGFVTENAHQVERLMVRLDGLSAREDVPVVISMPPELIDAIVPHVTAPRIALLCNPDPTDRIAAFGLVCSGERRGLLQDMSTDMDNVRLRRLADEVTRIARALSNLSATGPTPLHNGGKDFEMPAAMADRQIGYVAEPASLALETSPEPSEIRTLLRLRRLRDSYFDPLLFADPAWDMLLDLLAARLEDQQVAVSSLCIAAAVPPTTALRWIKAMTDSGLFERHADPADGRRIFIRLSDQATNALCRYFATAKRIGGLAV